MDHQDWTPVVLKKPVKTVQKEQVVRQSGNSGSGSQLSKNVREEFDPEKIKPVKKADFPLAQAIKNARATKNITQKDLDKQCQFPANTINSYESQTAVIVPAQLVKMERVLGCKLPRNKNKVIVE